MNSAITDNELAFLRNYLAVCSEVWVNGDLFRSWVRKLVATVDEERANFERCRFLAAKDNEEICQILGRALGYPRYCDDQKNFPDSTDADGVCVGEHIAVTLAMEAARKIEELNNLLFFEGG